MADGVCLCIRCNTRRGLVFPVCKLSCHRVIYPLLKKKTELCVSLEEQPPSPPTWFVLL